MKPIDLTEYVDLLTFPVEDLLHGICHSPWAAATFYGDMHHNVKRYSNRNAARLRNHFDTDTPLSNWHINLTDSTEPYHWAYTDSPNWKLLPHAQQFGNVVPWLREQNVLEWLGRVTVFITQGGHEEPHIDWVAGSEHSNARQEPIEFMWLSVGGKQIEFEGSLLPQCCWFDNRLSHRAVSSRSLTWSLRADGKFTDRIKTWKS